MKKAFAWTVALLIMLTAAASAPAEGKVVLQLTRCAHNLAAPDPEQTKKVEEAVNACLDGKGMNLEIRLADIGSDDFIEYVTRGLEKQEINLLWTASWKAKVGTNDLVRQNLLYDITDLLPGTSLYESMSSGQWESTRYQGRSYFIPVYKDNVEGYDIMFRKDLADKYRWDISSVTGLKDLEPMLEDAKGEGLKYPFLIQKTPMFRRWYIDRFDFFTADPNTSFLAVDRTANTVTDTLLTPEYAEFAHLMADWAEKGYVSPDEVNRITTDTTTQTHDWAVSWWTDVPVNEEASSRYHQQVVVQPVTGRYAHSNSALGSCYCVTAYSSGEQAKAAVDFMGFLYTDSTLADLYTFGIEGEDFNYTQEEGQMIRHVALTDAGKYNHSMWESASATIVTPMDNEPDNKADLYVDFNGGAEISVASGFRFDPRPVADAFEACSALYDEYGFPLETGGVPSTEVDAAIRAYQQALEEAGLQTVLEECEKQYAAWQEMH